MKSSRYYEIAFRGILPQDAYVLENWYAMTDQFGYATGFKNFNEIREKVLIKNPYCISSIIMISGREEPVGFVFAELKHLEQRMVLWIHIIIIDPTFQSKGLGTCVVNKLITYASIHHGAIASLVSVSEKNKKGLSFWHKLGFVRCNDLEESLSTFGTTGVAIMKRIIK